MPLATILVEDSATVRDSLIPALAEFADARVIAVAETADEAIAAFAAQAGVWRLAVVDLFLREGNGLHVLRALRARDPGRHVVLLTNYLTDEIRRRSLEAGADAVFDKSTEIESFLDRCAAYAREDGASGGG